MQRNRVLVQDRSRVALNPWPSLRRAGARSCKVANDVELYGLRVERCTVGEAHTLPQANDDCAPIVRHVVSLSEHSLDGNAVLRRGELKEPTEDRVHLS